MKRTRAIGLIWLSLILIAGCGSPAATQGIPTPAATQAAPAATPASAARPRPTLEPTRAAALAGTIVIDGSSTVFPITEAVAAEFRAAAPGVEVQLGVSGTGGGFKKFCAGEIDIAEASRPIKRDEEAACAANGIGFIEIPVAFDGISVVVHRDNTWADCLTVAELKRLWEPAATGVITTWRQLRPEWPATPIQLYGAGADSGTFDYFTSAIVGSEGASRSDYTGSEDDYLLAQDIAGNPGALGFFGYAYYREYQDRLKLVAVDAGAGCVTPAEETIASGGYQPLARPMFAYVRPEALDRPEMAAFVEFYLADLARIVEQVRSVPLPARAYELAALRISQRRLGSIFGGGSQIGISIERLLELESK